MRIGLIDVDGHAKKKKWGATIYPNLALCKISAWHKSQGHEVLWYEPMYSGHCDIVYVSKVFNFTPDIDKMLNSGISDSQLYKLAGNSICVDCMVALFSNLYFPQEQEQLTLF